MTVSEHLVDAARRLELAEKQIVLAKDDSATLENHHRWLSALTEYVIALSDVQRFTNESVHEKLHDFADRWRVPTFPAGEAPGEEVPGE